MFQITAIPTSPSFTEHVLSERFASPGDAEAEALRRNCKPFVPFYFQVEECDHGQG